MSFSSTRTCDLGRAWAAHPATEVPRVLREPGVLLSRRGFVAGAMGLLALGGCSRGDKLGETTIEFWTLALRPTFDDYIQREIARFESTRPGVRVRWVDVAYDALDRKLIAAAAAGRAPDVVNMADLNFARFSAMGAFADIGPLLPGAAGERYLPGALSLCSINGRLRGLPWYVNPQARLVNTDLLAQGGLSPETLAGDWSGLISQARAFRERSGAFLFTQSLGEESQLPIMLLAEGLPPLVVGEDGRLRSDISSPRIREYLALWVSLFQDGALPRDAATRGHAHLTEMYQNGRVAVISTGPNFLRRVRDVSPTIFENTLVLPGVVGALGRVHLPVMLLSVTNQSRHPELAAELAWHMTSPEAQTEFCKQAAIMPSTLASLDDSFFAPPGAAELAGPEGRLVAARAVAAATLQNAVAFTASLDCWPDLRRAFEDDFKRAILGSIPLDDALGRIDEQWGRILRASAGGSSADIPTPSPASMQSVQPDTALLPAISSRVPIAGGSCV